MEDFNTENSSDFTVTVLNEDLSQQGKEFIQSLKKPGTKIDEFVGVVKRFNDFVGVYKQAEINFHAKNLNIELIRKKYFKRFMNQRGCINQLALPNFLRDFSVLKAQAVLKPLAENKNFNLDAL